MKIGALVPIGLGNGNAEFLQALGPALEQRGFESVWIPEHVVLFDEYASRYPYTPDGIAPIPADAGLIDPFVALSFLAAGTQTLRLGTGICLVAQRNPLYTAKQVADLDVLSQGRVDFGVGLGWLREEYEALDVPWPRRGERTDEYVAVMRALWEDEVSAHDGPLYTLPACRMYPKPVQRPHPPIHVGGDSDAALRRVAHLGQGWFGMGHSPDALPAVLERLDAALAGQGRSRRDVQISVSPPLGPVDRTLASRYAELGVDRLNVALFAPGRDAMLALLDDVASEIVGIGAAP